MDRANNTRSCWAMFACDTPHHPTTPRTFLMLMVQPDDESLFLPNPTRPTKPEPIRSKPAGSGTEVETEEKTNMWSSSSKSPSKKRPSKPTRNPSVGIVPSLSQWVTQTWTMPSGFTRESICGRYGVFGARVFLCSVRISDCSRPRSYSFQSMNRAQSASPGWTCPICRHISCAIRR